MFSTLAPSPHLRLCDADRVIEVLALSLLAIVAGVLAERRWKDSAKLASGRILELIVYLMLPIIIFFTVIHLKVTESVAAGLGFGWIERLVVIAIAWFIGTHVLKLKRPEIGALMAVVAIANTGYLGIPLTALLLGSKSINLAVAYDAIVNSPVVLLIGFAVGAAYGTRAGESPKERIKAFFTKNPPLYAQILGLLAPSSLDPSWGTTLSHSLALAMAPLAFFALGVNLMLEHDETGVRIFPPPLTPAVGTALALRLLVAPGVMVGLSLLLIKVPKPFLLEAGMASGLNALVVAHLYGLDMKITVGAIAWSTTLVVSAATAVTLMGGI